jgi:hypothetical protein
MMMMMMMVVVVVVLINTRYPLPDILRMIFWFLTTQEKIFLPLLPPKQLVYLSLEAVFSLIPYMTNGV